ncbi:hypothetical protein Rsub_00471 [Raphidocelis subcapitata]|uniref:Uncharacterized protein n=1 Tax=Raphidocelis subcapitata TaxID=307507 RepID=A0A2V0NQE4_9CHLO|nr:hypothetical protein Rsub_00471 [Raphidocelis subcapitata]|eukprot:GBF87760.1 hypothetical protein Rsub_00471 [Raphidocelis subcapitata]
MRQRARCGAVRRRGGAPAAAARLAALLLLLLLPPPPPHPLAGGLPLLRGAAAAENAGHGEGDEYREGSHIKFAPVMAGTTSLTCWSPDCGAPFPVKRCHTVGYRSVECPALLDAGIAYRSLEECCRDRFGDAGCGSYCFVKDAAAPPPDRVCRQVRDPSECLKRRDAPGGAHGTLDECCSANFGGAGCATFPDRCYAADPLNEGRCRALTTVEVCSAAMDRREAWPTRAECCAANRFPAAACKAQARCWAADAARAPSRVCREAASDDCPQRQADGAAWASEEECCRRAWGKGRGCKEFPEVCYEVLSPPPARPADGCRKLTGRAACAAALDARPKSVFPRMHDCCAAALPGVWVNYTADASEGCRYAPETCWSPPRKASPPHRECEERQDDAAGCARDVTLGAGAWGAREACCRGTFGGRGCRRFPDACWVKRQAPEGGSPDRDCERLTGAAVCAAREDAGQKLFGSRNDCCRASFGAKGCRVYPAECFVPKPAADTPDRACQLLAGGAAACADAIDAGKAFETREQCCKQLPGGCRTYPTTCYAPDALDKTLPDRSCRAHYGGDACKWEVYQGLKYESMSACCSSHGCATHPAKCWSRDAASGECTFLWDDPPRCRAEGAQGLASSSREECECKHFGRGCGAASCWLVDEGAASGAPGACRQVSSSDVCWAGIGLQTAWRTREECCVRNFDFWSDGCQLSCYFDPKAVEGPAQKWPPPTACAESHDAALCSKLWASGEAFVHQRHCCEAHYPNSACGGVKPEGSCWARDAAAAAQPHCVVQIGTAACAAGRANETAWDTQAACCGLKGCAQQPRPPPPPPQLPQARVQVASLAAEGDDGARGGAQLPIPLPLPSPGRPPGSAAAPAAAPAAAVVAAAAAHSSFKQGSAAPAAAAGQARGKQSSVAAAAASPVPPRQQPQQQQQRAQQQAKPPPPQQQQQHAQKQPPQPPSPSPPQPQPPPAPAPRGSRLPSGMLGVGRLFSGTASCWVRDSSGGCVSQELGSKLCGARMLLGMAWTSNAACCKAYPRGSCGGG